MKIIEKLSQQEIDSYGEDKVLDFLICGKSIDGEKPGNDA